jgi:hypothetical protein
MARTFHVTIILLSAFAVSGATSAAQTFLTIHCGDGTKFVAALYRGTRAGLPYFIDDTFSERAGMVISLRAECC